MTQEIAVLKLKNGTEEAAPLVRVTMMALRSLMQDHPIAFFELVTLCRDRNHTLFGNTGVILRDQTLIQSDGQPHDSIRNIVVSAVTGDMMAMRLGSPVAE